MTLASPLLLKMFKLYKRDSPSCITPQYGLRNERNPSYTPPLSQPTRCILGSSLLQVHTHWSTGPTSIPLYWMLSRLLPKFFSAEGSYTFGRNFVSRTLKKHFNMMQSELNELFSCADVLVLFKSCCRDLFLYINQHIRMIWFRFLGGVLLQAATDLSF